jgi:reactive intermediate/imine deaminase
VVAAAAALTGGLVLAGPVLAQQADGEGESDERPQVRYLDAGTVLPADLPFSEAVAVDGVLYLSGMIGVVPGTLGLAEGGIEAEARQTMENIRAVLEAHGSSLDRVIRCTVYLADIGEWDAFNSVYGEFFEAPYPARSALGVDGLALDARVEVECMAAAG